MKLYMYPASTTCMPILLFCAEHNIALDQRIVDLMNGEHMGADFVKINPMHRVPMLEDGDMKLTESSAILKYLAEKVGTEHYPKDDIRKRAQINERMDWFNTGFYMDYGYNLVYPQVLPHIKRGSEAAQRATLAWGQEKSRHWLALLNDHWIGPENNFVCGSEITLADYMGSSFVTLGTLIGQQFDPYPNIIRWIEAMKSLPNWDGIYQPFVGWAASVQDQDYVTV